MRHSSTLYVGRDVHRETIAVAYAPEGRSSEVALVGTIGRRQCDIDEPIRQLSSKTTPLVFVYETSSSGYWLHRYLTKKHLTF